MPQYVYKCAECEVIFEITHPIAERLVDCDHCNTLKSLERIPALPFVLKKNNNDARIERPGKVVDDFISDARQELEREKEELSKKEY